MIKEITKISDTTYAKAIQEVKENSLDNLLREEKDLKSQIEAFRRLLQEHEDMLKNVQEEILTVKAAGIKTQEELKNGKGE